MDEEEQYRNELVLKDIPYVKHAHMPGNEKQQDYLLNMSSMNRQQRDEVVRALDNYIK